MEPIKQPLEGRKTLIINAVIAAAALYPPIGVWVQAHPELVLQGLAVVNIALRFATKGKVRLFK